MTEYNPIQALLAALPDMFPGTQNIPLKNIRPNPDNPGAAITDDQIKELGENIRARGLLNSIRVNPDRANPLAGGAQPHPDNFRIKADGRPWELGDFNFIVLTGENRYRAALWLKWETIKGEIFNPTPLEATEMIRLDNAIRERGWWADYESIEQEIKAGPNLTQDQVAIRLKFDKPKVNRAIRLLPLLNPEARRLISSVATNSNKGFWAISELAVAKLAGLGPGTGLKRGVRKKDPATRTPDPTEGPSAPPSGVLYPYPAIPPETQDLVYRTLVVACDHQMTEAQVGKLVEKVQAGNSPETFDKTAPTVSSHPVTHPTHQSEESQPANADSPHAVTHPHHAHTATSATPTSPTPKTTRGEPAGTPSADDKPGIFWQWMLGIKFISHLKSKYKKGEPLTLNEKMLVGLYRLYDWVLKPIGKHLGRFFKWAGKGIWKSLKKAFGKVFGKTVEVVLPWLLVALLVWGLLAFFHFAVISPWHWVEHKIGSMFRHEDITPAQTPSANGNNGPLAQSNLVSQLVASTQMPTPPPVAPKKKVEKTAPAIAYQPSVSFAPPASPSQTLYDPKILEQEIAALPKNCIVKSFPVLTDETMPGDVAGARLQAAADPDKYTLFVGGIQQTLSTINATTTGLTIQYKSADPLSGFLNGSQQPNWLWEDVKYIHTDEIDIQGNSPSVIFQITLVLAGSKNALTFHCSTEDDLNHLVSTLQYFIRASRLGRDTALAGMPYRNQGILLAGDNQVQKLWADSPAGRAGVNLGDHLWSVGFITPKQQERKDLEAGLSTLPFANGNNNGPLEQPNLAPRLVGSAQVTLFTASDSVWDKALMAFHAPGQGNPFKPKLRKVILNEL